MFQNQISSRMKDALCEDLVRYCSKIFKRIRRISKYYIELFTTYLKKLEDIVTDYSQVVHSEF